MAREYFNAYHSYLESMKRLSDAEAGRLFRALLKYSMTGILDDLPGNERFVADGMVAQIDRDKQKYAETCHARKAAAESRWDNDANAYKKCKSIICNANDAKEKEKDKEKDKAKNKAKDNTGGGSAAPNVAPPVALLPLNTGEDYPITQEQVDEWARLYPAVDIEQQLRSMKGWLDANKTRRKTRNGIERFIVSWLSREQDRGHKPGTTANNSTGTNNVFAQLLQEGKL